jgi:hypothetical protein
MKNLLTDPFCSNQWICCIYHISYSDYNRLYRFLNMAVPDVAAVVMISTSAIWSIKNNGLFVAVA